MTTYKTLMGLLIANYHYAVFGLESALFINSDSVDEFQFDLFFKKGNRRINDQLIRPWYLAPHLFEIGITEIEEEGATFPIYDINITCVHYLFLKDEMSAEYFERGKRQIKRLILENKANPFQIQKYIRLFPKANSLQSDFENLILRDLA